MEARHQKKKGAAAPVCAGCHAATARYACGGCLGNARYCGARCQRRHWPAHERACVAAQQMLHLARHYRATSEKGGIGARAAAGGRVLYAGQPVKRRREGGGDDDDAAMDFEPHQPDDDGSPLFGSDDDDDGGAAAAAGDSDDDASPDAKRARPASWAALERALRLGDLPNELLVEIALAMTPHDLRTFVRAVARIPARPNEGLPARSRSEDAEVLLDVVASDTVWLRFYNRDFGQIPLDLRAAARKIDGGIPSDDWNPSDHIGYRRYWAVYARWLALGKNFRWLSRYYVVLCRRSARGELPDASIARDLQWNANQLAAATGDVRAFTETFNPVIHVDPLGYTVGDILRTRTEFMAAAYGLSLEIIQFMANHQMTLFGLTEAADVLFLRIESRRSTMLEQTRAKEVIILDWILSVPPFNRRFAFWNLANDIINCPGHCMSTATPSALRVLEKLVKRADFDPNGTSGLALTGSAVHMLVLNHSWLNLSTELEPILHSIMDNPLYRPQATTYNGLTAAHAIAQVWLPRAEAGLRLFKHAVFQLSVEMLSTQRAESNFGGTQRFLTLTEFVEYVFLQVTPNTPYPERLAEAKAAINARLAQLSQ